MAGNNSPIVLTDAPECSVLKISYITQTPNGPLEDDDVILAFMVKILFKTSDRSGRLVCQGYRVPISRLTEELIVAEMMGKGRIPESIIAENPSLVSFAKEILLTGQYMARHRAPEQTLLFLNVKSVLPVNRLPDNDVIGSNASESEFRSFVSVRDIYGDGIDQTDDEDTDTDDDDEDDDDDYEIEDDDDEEEDNENAIRIFLEGWEWIEWLEEVRVKNEPSFNTECPICLEELRVDSTAIRLPCLHLFHGGCIFKWLNSGSSKFCPLCRFQLR